MKTKKTLVGLFLVMVMLMNCIPAFANEVSGTKSTWEYDDGLGGGFEITITLTSDGKLYGSHYAWANKGNRIDDSRGEISLVGTVFPEDYRSYNVVWRSSYSDAWGYAVLNINADGRDGYWRIESIEKPGDMYIPDDAILRRVK